ncbi:MAG: adenylate/guanylate cyclase domain-containing protein [Caldimonas sp.]
MTDLQRWLQNLGLQKYEEILRSNDVDLLIALDLTEQDLEKLGLSLGHRRKFIAAAAQLRASDEPVAAPAQNSPADKDKTRLERRQVTIVFSDLVGSTALASGLDPEDMGQLLRDYRGICSAVVGRYDGHVAQFLGDGILAYFGYPKALEHAAERAVRAGLEIVAEVGRLGRPDGRPLECRVGIATGLVAAGTTGTEGEQTVVGETPNLAARLQALAAPGEVLVAASTHRLTGDFFEYSYAGEHAAKGFDAPVPAWRAIVAGAAESRFIAARAAVAAPVVGRERELALLGDAWQRAVQGNGHMVVVSGEAGMGKSRLLEALVERVRDQPHRLLRAQCSPYHTSSVLYPFVQLLRHRLDLRRELTDAENLARIERVLERIDRASRQATLLMAELLELRTEDALSQAEMTAEQRKGATLDLLEAFLVSPLEGATVLLLVEDAHWSDPSTLALIERLLRRIERDQALVVVTQRPDMKPAWAALPQATSLRCKQLGREHCAALVRHVAGRTAIAATIIGEITDRSDGVPLFVEELTKAVLEMQSAESGSVPTTLQDSLMARLDRLGGAKEIAQTASIIGRHFSHDMLATITGTGEAELKAGLERLHESGLVFATSSESERSYSFNHALVQEAAYASLSRQRRRTLHAKAARAMEAALAAGDASELAVVAHHYGRADEPEKSFEFWVRAADRASQLLAFSEAVADFGAALGEAGRIADPDKRARLELDAHLKLSATLVHQKGAASNEVEPAHQEAYRLAKQLNAGPQLFQATWGLYVNAARNRRFDQAKLWGDELLALSEELGDDDLKFEALHHRWGFAYFTGQIPETLAHTERGTRLYEPARHHRFSYTFAGHDPGVCAYCVHAIALGVAGDADKIKPGLDVALALSDQLQHPLTLVFAHAFVCAALHFTRDAVASEAAASQLVHDATKYDLPLYRSTGAFWLGVTEAMNGDPKAGLRRMEPAFEPAQALGHFGSLSGAVMADSLARAGRARDALALIARLHGEVSDPHTGLFVSELWRLHGEITATLGDGDAAEAERSLRTALRIARVQGAALLQSRAGIGLARHLGERGRREEARQALAEAEVDSLADRATPEVAAAERLHQELA